MEKAQVRLFGRYELLVPIARGGMGEVWVARLRGSRGFQKLVAVKTISPQASGLPRVESMLQEEARLGALIQHPNVVHTIELGEHEGTPYLVMEWVDGQPLHQIMRRALERQSVPLTIAVNLVAQASRGLHAVHEARDEDGVLLGLVHRDVSPQNILISYSGRALLFDFGIAKAMNQKGSFTQIGEIKGKFSFMAPEQLLGKSVDRRADIFAMGIVLYWLSVGRHPFKDDNPGAAVLNITSTDRAPAPSQYVADYPAALERVVLRALEKSPDRRFESAEQLAVALQRALPAAFAAGLEVETRTYLRRLLPDSARDRRTRLRAAEEAIERLRDTQVKRVPSATPMEGSVDSIVRRRTRMAWIGSVFGALAVIAIVVVTLLRFAWRSQASGASEAPTRAPMPKVSVISAEPARVAAPNDDMPVVPLEALSLEPATSARPAPRPPAPRPRQAPLKSRHRPVAPVSPRDGSDVGLLPPDYARDPSGD